MANQTTPYADIVSGIEALAGDSLTTTEKSRLKHIINRRARVAYRLYDSWPEWTVVKEQRLVRGDGGVEKEPTDADGDATGENLVDTFLDFHELEPFNDRSRTSFDFYEQSDRGYPVGYSRTYDSDATIGLSQILPGLAGGDVPIWIYTSDSHNLKANDYIKLSGVSNDNTDVNKEWKVTTVASDTLFYVDLGSGASVAGSYDVSAATLMAPQVWCSYKKRLTVTYGDGSGETTTVPRRWADYLIQAGYADFLRSDGQTEKAMAEEQVAQEIIDREIYMLDRSPNFLGHKIRVSTHTARGNR